MTSHHYLSPRPAYKSTLVLTLFWGSGQCRQLATMNVKGELNGLWLRSAAEQGKGGLTPVMGDRWRHRPLPLGRVPVTLYRINCVVEDWQRIE